MPRSYKKTPSCHMVGHDRRAKKRFNRNLRHTPRIDEMTYEQHDQPA